MTVSTPVRQHIRILDAQGLSWRRMAREVGVSRQTVGKYAELEDCSPKPPERTAAGSKPDPFEPVIDKWLQVDRMMPRKQRHSAMRVWRRLRDERGYDGSHRLVQRYVRQRKRDWREPGDGFTGLEWEPGVMQVDFGRVLAVIGGERTGVHCLVVTFPYSNMRYVVALPGENAECVCEGSETVFSHVGLAPRVMVFDDATGAAHRVAWDRITIVDVFQRFVERYRVEVRFCNPGSGWEKGGVENAVGFLRRDLMVPMPNAGSYRKLVSWMLSRCDEIAGASHCRKDVPIADLFAEEKARMLPLPRMPYDSCRRETRRADREGNVEIDSDRYLAGPSWHGWNLDVGLRAFGVEIRTQDGRFVAKLPRAYGRAADGEEPGEPAARFGAQVARVGRIPHPRRFPMARRVSAGETPDDVPAPDLHAYDRFMRPETQAKAA